MQRRVIRMDGRWVLRTSLKPASTHFRAERFIIVIRKNGITFLPHFITILCFFFRSSGQRRGPIVSHLPRATSSPSPKDLPLPAARVSVPLFVHVFPY